MIILEEKGMMAYEKVYVCNYPYCVNVLYRLSEKFIDGRTNTNGIT